MKIVCPYCENVNEVVKGATTISCSKCEQSFTMEDGKKKTVSKYKELQNRAYNCLYVSQEYEEAIDNYEECLLIKENDLSSVIGICSAKMNLSTFDDAKFKEVIPTIEEYDIALNVENTNLFLHFIKDAISTIEYYFEQTDKRIISENTFINQKLFDSYIETCKDITTLLIYLKDSFELMDKAELEAFRNDFPSFDESFTNLTSNVNSRLNKAYNINDVGDIEVIDGEQKVLNTNKKSLDLKDISEKSVIIKNEKGMLYFKIFIPLTAVFGALTLILFIIFGVKKESLYIYLAAGSLILTGAVYLIYRLLLKNSNK